MAIEAQKGTPQNEPLTPPPNVCHEYLSMPANEGFVDGRQERRFRELLTRLETLKRWKELAIRPDRDDSFPEDFPLLEQETDDCVELERRCQQARDELNKNLPTYQAAEYESDLVVGTSTILDAGLGLFYKPSSSTIGSCGKQSSLLIPKGALLCYYYGHLHDFHSANLLQEKNYLMMVRDEVLVDPGPLPHIKARYINDPLNEEHVNCAYMLEKYRSAVVAIRDIAPGEEPFASYGDGYWSQHSTPGRPKI